MSTDPNNPTHKFVCVIGAGISGVVLGAEVHRQKVLKRPEEEMVIFESNGGYGGVWWNNTYPGAACDIFSHIYSISWFPKPDWSRRYSPQEEIQQYYDNFASTHNLPASTKFNHRVLACHWSDAELLWHVTVENTTPETPELLYYKCNVVVSAIGQLNRPKWAPIADRDLFHGPQWHTAEWNHSVSLEGKRVGIIGIGPSAAQVIPTIAPIVKELHVFQRSPPHCFPRQDYEFPDYVKWIFKYVPGAQWLHHVWLYSGGEMLPYRAVHMASEWNKVAEAICLGHMHSQIPESEIELRKKLTPRYSYGCKRPLFSDVFYPTFLRDNVTLHSAIPSRFTENGVVIPGTKEDKGEQEVELDVIIHATGFLTQELLGHIDVTGTANHSLRQQWGDTAQAYLGCSVHNFPNFLLQYGPATGLLWGSLTFMFEQQALYNTQIMKDVYATLQSGAGSRRAWAVKPEVEEEFNNAVQTKIKTLAMTDGRCSSFYKNARGVVTTNWPWRLAWYWWRLRSVEWGKLERWERSLPRGALR